MGESQSQLSLQEVLDRLKPELEALGVTECIVCFRVEDRKGAFCILNGGRQGLHECLAQIVLGMLMKGIADPAEILEAATVVLDVARAELEKEEQG